MAGLGLGRRTRIVFWLLVQAGLMSANYLHYLLVREGQEGFGSWGFVVTVALQFLHFATAAYGPGVLTSFAGVVGALRGVPAAAAPPVTRARLAEPVESDDLIGYDELGQPLSGSRQDPSRAPTGDLETPRD